MKSFQDFLKEADVLKKGQVAVSMTTTSAFQSSTKDHRAMSAEVSISGSTLSLVVTDGRSITIKDAGELISGAGLKDGMIVATGFNTSGLGKGNFQAIGKNEKSSKSLTFMVDGKLMLDITYSGNAQWKQVVQGNWNSMSGGVKGEASYSLGKDTQNTKYPRPDEEIEFTTAAGQKDTGTVVKMNGALKVLDVKDSKGKKVQVNMVYDV